MNVSVIHDHAVSASKYYRLISILTVFVFVKGTSALIMAQVLKCGEITIIFLIMSPRSSLLLPFSGPGTRSHKDEKGHIHMLFVIYVVQEEDISFVALHYQLAAYGCYQ